MMQNRFLRNLPLGGLGLVAGFLSLAVAVPLEPPAPVPLVVLLSPGLKIAEAIMPNTHGSLAGTFRLVLADCDCEQRGDLLRHFCHARALADTPRRQKRVRTGGGIALPAWLRP